MGGAQKVIKRVFNRQCLYVYQHIDLSPFQHCALRLVMKLQNRT
jgi:hypothetical protein